MRVRSDEVKQSNLNLYQSNKDSVFHRAFDFLLSKFIEPWLFNFVIFRRKRNRNTEIATTVLTCSARYVAITSDESFMPSVCTHSDVCTFRTVTICTYLLSVYVLSSNEYEQQPINNGYDYTYLPSWAHSKMLVPLRCATQSLNAR